MKDIDQEALEIVEKWEREAAGNPYSQQKAMLQVAVIKILKDREFTMRVPPENDRDADIVLSEAARRLTTLRSRLEALVGELEQPPAEVYNAVMMAADTSTKRIVARKIREILGGE